jgi:hypothetical protein
MNPALALQVGVMSFAITQVIWSLGHIYLWPIVLVIDAVMITVAVAAGGALGNMLRKERMHAA